MERADCGDSGLFGMRRDRPVRLVLKRFLSAVEDLDPAKQRSPGNVVTPADKADIFCGAVELTGMIFSVEFVWKISPGLCYSIHGGWALLRMLGCGTPQFRLSLKQVSPEFRYIKIPMTISSAPCISRTSLQTMQNIIIIKSI